MKLFKAFCFTLTFIFLTSALTLAHNGATGVVKERMDGMSAMKDAMAIIGNMLKGKSEFDSVLSWEPAIQIKLHAEEINKLFPNNEESRQHASQARVELWDNWQKFEELSVQMISKADDLMVSLTDNDKEVITSTFQQVGKACSECHLSYRIKN